MNIGAGAPEAIGQAVASLPPEQMFELMQQMKQCIHNDAVEARNMLLQSPQLAYALLQAQVVMKIVDPDIAIKMLQRKSVQKGTPDVPASGKDQKSAPSTDEPQMGVFGSFDAPPPPSRVTQDKVHPQQTSILNHQQGKTREARDPRKRLHGKANPNQPGSSANKIRKVEARSDDEEKAKLIKQVLQLSDEQIRMLPEEQKRNIMALKSKMNLP